MFATACKKLAVELNNVIEKHGGTPADNNSYRDRQSSHSSIMNYEDFFKNNNGLSFRSKTSQFSVIQPSPTRENQFLAISGSLSNSKSRFG